MRRLFSLILLLLPLAPLTFGFVEARRYVENERRSDASEKSRFVLEAAAGLTELMLSRPSLSRAELFEMGRRIDGLEGVDGVILLYRTPGGSEDGGFEPAYQTPGAVVAESADWESLLEPLVSASLREARESLGDVTGRLQSLGLEIVDAVVQGGDGGGANLQRLDREFKRLYEEGNARLSDISRSFQQTIEVPTGRVGGEPVGYLAQPVLSFARSRNIEVLGVVLIRQSSSEPARLENAFLLRLGASLILAFAVSVVASVAARFLHSPGEGTS